MANETPPAKEFRVPTTAQVERVYQVKATSIEQAHARVRAYLSDPDMLAPGVVVEVDSTNTSPEQVKKSEIKEATGPRPVAETARKAS